MRGESERGERVRERGDGGRVRGERGSRDRDGESVGVRGGRE